MTGGERLRWAGLALTAVAVSAGVSSYLGSPAHAVHDPVHGLQQLDLLYLDEPAPGRDQLGLQPGRPAVVVFCAEPSCPLPELPELPDRPEAHVVRSTDPELAERYALQTANGRVGPGYALVDAQGRVRYRTFDPGLAEHEREIGILVAGLS